MAKQNEKLFDNVIKESYLRDNVIYTLEQRSDNLWIVRKGLQTLSLDVKESEARKVFDKYKPFTKGGEEQMNGIDKARATADRLKAETAEKEEIKEKAIAEVKNQLELVRQNSNLSKMFEEEAKKEMSDGMGSQPLLKIHTLGRSHNELMDGSQPDDGDFFYTPSQEAFKNPNIHLLVMSDGFYAEGLPDDSGKVKIGYNILIGGTVIDSEMNRTMRPFLMYITSQSIRQSFWDFRNELNKYARLLRVPKMALVVNMTHEKVANPNPKWVKINPKVNNIKFSIVKLEDGSPALVTDENEFEALVDIQAMLKEMVDSIVSAKSVEKPTIEMHGNSATAKEAVEGEVTSEGDPNNIPF